MGNHISMTISVDSPSDETLNRGPLELHLWRQYEFPVEINIVQISFFFFSEIDRQIEADRQKDSKIDRDRN